MGRSGRCRRPEASSWSNEVYDSVGKGGKCIDCSSVNSFQYKGKGPCKEKEKLELSGEEVVICENLWFSVY